MPNFLLERRYERDVERVHGLPKGIRRARRVTRGREPRRDTVYERYGVRVELDGIPYHRDKRRRQGWDGESRPCHKPACLLNTT